MRIHNYQQMLALAKSRSGPFSLAVADSTRREVLSQEAADALRRRGQTVDDGDPVEVLDHTQAVVQLERSGFRVVFVDKANPDPPGKGARSVENGAYCDILDSSGGLAAQGRSGGRHDALLHALLGAVREEYAKVAVAGALDTAQIKVDDALRAKLESLLIASGHAALDAQVRVMVAMKQ